MRIAALAGKLDFLFISSPPKRIQLFFILIEGAPDFEWLSKIIPAKKQIVARLKKSLGNENSSDDDLIKRSSLTEMLKKFRVDAFVTSHQGSFFLEKWSEKNKIKLIATDVKDQVTFENKIWFDQFLNRSKITKPRSVICLGKDLKKSLTPPLVIQEQNSFGSFGTYIIHSDIEQKTFVRKNSLKKNSRYLVREFQKGRTYGITVFVDASHIVLSSCRLQCFYPYQGVKPVFAGIQWVKTAHFTQKAKFHINDTFQKLGTLLHNQEFFGFANFDFILTPANEVKVIECNPRLSSASPHLFSCHELTSSINTASLFLSKYISKPKSLERYPLPQSKFEGALLDIVCSTHSEEISKTIPNGSYQACASGYKLMSTKPSQLTALYPTLFYSSEASIGQTVEFEETCGSLITNFPLFSPRGTLTIEGEKTNKIFLKLLMLVRNIEQKKKWVQKILDAKDSYQEESLVHIVEEILAKKPLIELTIQDKQTPCYVIDHQALEHSLSRYINAFQKYLPHSKHFYAVKVNHHPIILKRIFNAGFGADVSSDRELRLALDAGASSIVFSGPGKTKKELEYALKYSDKVIINIDSFGELKKLDELSKEQNCEVCAGVRVSFKEHGSWDKFGIPLEECRRFFEAANKTCHIKLIGIQFHISWNADSKPYSTAIQLLGNYLKENFSSQELNALQFVDIGGGFRPYKSEGYYPDATPLGGIIQAASEELNFDPEFILPYLVTAAIQIEEYAQGISEAIKTHLRPFLKCGFYTEPGRIICNNAMHVILQIEDVKNDSCVILNGGTNIVGFERFEFDYFPIINLTHPRQGRTPLYGVRLSLYAARLLGPSHIRLRAFRGRYYRRPLPRRAYLFKYARFHKRSSTRI